MRRGNKPGRTSVLLATPACQANATMRSAGLVSTATCCLARSCVNPHLRAGLEELLRQGPWAPGSTEAGLGLLAKLPRLTEALGAHREPLPWLRVQPHRSRRVTTPVSLTPRALRPLHYLLDLKYSSYYAKMKKVKAGAGASWFPRWPRAAIPGVVPRTGQLHR